tara:strand:+ start:2390 stop:2596 length:207 start_codon:yes stop_codon:yes gene_type:complete
MSNKINKVMSFKTWTGLTFSELFETGRLGLEPKDNVDEVIRRLWPADNLKDHKENRKLREEVIAHLYK